MSEKFKQCPFFNVKCGIFAQLEKAREEIKELNKKIEELSNK